MNETFRSTNGPHPVDVVVGHHIRTLRLRRRLSQSGLADRIGVTFQQVQKYENGDNRVAASRLYQIAVVLCVSISEFYEGLPDPKLGMGQAATAEWIMAASLPDAAGLRLLEAFEKLSTRLRKASYGLITAMAEVPSHSGEAGDHIADDDDGPTTTIGFDTTSG